MSVKGLKQKVAAALVVAMMATNVLSAAAANPGTPSASRTVSVTFDGGKGGTWPTTVASKADAATKANANVEDIIGSESNASTRIVRNYKVDESMKDDNNKYFISLDNSIEYRNGTDWKKIVAPEGMVLNAWYDGESYYTDVETNTKEIYNGAVLEAVWQAEGVKGPSVSDEAKELLGEEPVIVEGLKDGQQLVVAGVAPEDAAKYTDAVVEEFLADKELKLVGETSEIVKLDIDVEGHEDGQAVTINLPVPQDLDLEGLETLFDLVGIHFKKDGTTEPVAIQVNEAKTYLTFKLDSFSPFYIVKAAKAEQNADKVKVTIENVKNGYLIAFTGDYSDGTLLPIGETVELEKGTELRLNPRGYYFSDTWEGEIESITAKFADDTSELLENNYSYIVEKDCTLTAKFDQVKQEEDERDLFDVWVRPSRILQEGKFEGEVHVEKLNAAGDDYEEFTGWTLRMATAEDLKENNIDEYYGEDIDKFSFNSETNMLTSVGDLELGQYDVPFIIHYEDKDHIVRYSNTYGDTTYSYPYSAYVNVGAGLYYYTTLVDFGENTYGDVYLENKRISDNGSLKWKDAKPTEEDMAEFQYGVPKMYNYDFQGWQDYQGKAYENDDQALASRYTGSYYIYSLFTDKDGKAYNGVEPLYDGEGPAKDPEDPENPDNPDDPNNPGGNGGNTSTSGGGSRYGGGGSASAAKDYTMHGNWMATENGWRFLKDSGEYATNTWGYINGLWYYFDAQGNMVTGWYYVNGQWYYMNPAAGSVQGAMMTGWVLDPTYNAWFYLTGSGAMATGWQQINGLWYYLNPVSDGTKGVMAANTYVDGYFVNADGVWVQ